MQTPPKSREQLYKISIPVLAFLVVLVGIYPASPVLMLLLPIDQQISLTLACLTALGVGLYIVRTDKSAMDGRYTRQLTLLIALLALLLIVKAVIHQFPIAIRELLVALLAICLLMLSIDKIRRLLHTVTYLVTVLLIVSMFLVLLAQTGAIYLPDWHVSALPELSRTNPIVSRHEIELGSNWYMPFYLSVLPLHDTVDEVAFGLSFRLQPLLFTEPTYSWNFLAPLFFYVIADRSIRMRGVVLSALSIALAWGLSVWGLIAVMLSLLLMVLARTLGSSWKVIILTLVLALLSVTQSSVETVLNLIGGNKLYQFQYFSEVINFSNVMLPIGPPDNPYDGAGGEKNRSYGSLHILFTYGLLGLFAQLTLLTFAAMTALKVLVRWRQYKHLIRYMALAVTSAFLIGLKTPYFISLWHLMFLAFLVRLYDLRDASALRGNPPIFRGG